MRELPENTSQRPARDPLSQLLGDIHLGGSSYLFAQFNAPWAFRMSNPDHAAFHILTEGSALLTMSDGRTLTLHSGELLLFPRGSAHMLSAQACRDAPLIESLLTPDTLLSRQLKLGGEGAKTRMICGHFRYDKLLARPLMHALPDYLHVLRRAGGMPDWLSIGIHFINQESRENRPGHHAIVDRICELMLIEILREHVENLPQDCIGWLAALRDPQLSRLLSALHQQPGENWRLESMAAVAGLSRSALAERFSRVMGQPAMDYLTQHRLSLTAWYLRSSNLSLARIAERVGYASESALSQAFRRELGITPRDYRKNTPARA